MDKRKLLAFPKIRFFERPHLRIANAFAIFNINNTTGKLSLIKNYCSFFSHLHNSHLLYFAYDPSPKGFVLDLAHTVVPLRVVGSLGGEPYAGLLHHWGHGLWKVSVSCSRSVAWHLKQRHFANLWLPVSRSQPQSSPLKQSPSTQVPSMEPLNP